MLSVIIVTNQLIWNPTLPYEHHDTLDSIMDEEARLKKPLNIIGECNIYGWILSGISALCSL